MDNSALRLIGLARKAGRIEVGEEPVGAAARARKARLIVAAGDAADNTLRRACHFAQAGNSAMVQCQATKEELGRAVGRSSCALLAFTDAGLAAAFAEKLAQTDREQFGEAAEELSVRARRVLQRQREKRQHEKNLQKAKAKPWAAPQQPRMEKNSGGDPGRRHAAPAHKKHRNGPSQGTKRGGGRQVT